MSTFKFKIFTSNISHLEYNSDQAIISHFKDWSQTVQNKMIEEQSNSYCLILIHICENSIGMLMYLLHTQLIYRCVIISHILVNIGSREHGFNYRLT